MKVDACYKEYIVSFLTLVELNIGLA
ncbi:protein of unknown function [Nitrospina watsonii]|uniref:Uncharacterized protein n=1 Tax=Nitrospina watsonii TaxID=1323948 RepID=A0ABN8VZL9_9BACT|nr:protein of unknown function [Nitrospina watsonii]